MQIRVIAFVFMELGVFPPGKRNMTVLERRMWFSKCHLTILFPFMEDGRYFVAQKWLLVPFIVLAFISFPGYYTFFYCNSLESCDSFLLSFLKFFKCFMYGSGVNLKTLSMNMK